MDIIDALSRALLQLSENQIALSVAIRECAKEMDEGARGCKLECVALCLSILDINHLSFMETIQSLKSADKV